MSDWKTLFDIEMERARAAREQKKEGQARVCARRAAGIVLREYFSRHDIPVRTPSAYDLLNQLLQLPGVPSEAYHSAEYLVLRVTEEFKLPVDVDLIEEAKKMLVLLA